jgi:hypothetical protein
VGTHNAHNGGTNDGNNDDHDDDDDRVHTVPRTRVMRLSDKSGSAHSPELRARKLAPAATIHETRERTAYTT